MLRLGDAASFFMEKAVGIPPMEDANGASSAQNLRLAFTFFRSVGHPAKPKGEIDLRVQYGSTVRGTVKNDD